MQALLRLPALFAACIPAGCPRRGRRLFQPLDADGERVPDKTVKAFQDLYKSDSAEFPREARGGAIWSY